MGEDVFLDNLPDVANMILNVLWDNNREMMLSELTELVNQKYETDWSKRDIKRFVKVLVNSDYVEKKCCRFKVYYVALGADFEIA